MKARILIVSAVLCALILGAANAEAAFVTRRLAHYAGSDSAGVVDFTPIVTGADTLSIPQLDALTVKAGAAVSPHKGTKYYTPGNWTPYGTTDVVYVVHITAASGFTFESATDSIGITIQYSSNPAAASPTWFSGTEALIDPTSATPYVSIVTTPFPGQRVIVKWNDTDTMGLPTKTMNAFLMFKEN